MLEVGPGSGYNTLAFFEWNAKHLDLIEPNPAGIEDMETLFCDRKIDKERYTVYNTIVEEFRTDKQYDIVIAESFLQHMENQDIIIECLKSLVKPGGGVVVVTCLDEISMFVERMKRLIAHFLVKDIAEYNEKVDYLTGIFEPQLEQLRGVSRNAKDWVQDQMLNSAHTNYKVLSMEDAIIKFGKQFEMIGSSPNVFCDYSWYKDVWHDNNAQWLKQFRMKRASLLLAGMPEITLDEDSVFNLWKVIEKITSLEIKYEKLYDNTIIIQIINELLLIDDIMKKITGFYDIYQEIIAALRCLLKETKDFDFKNYDKFFMAFGRSQQYIAFSKTVR